MPPKLGGQMDAGWLYAIPIRCDLFNRRTERTGQNVHESLWQQPHLVCDSCHYRKYSCYFISFLMDKADCKFVRVISSGTIVILVFHRELLHPMLKWISQQNFDAITSDALMALSAVIVLAAFYPLILIVKRVFPIVLGRRMKS